MSHPVGATLRELGYSLIDAGDYWRMAAVFRGGRNPTSVAIEKRTGRFRDFAMDTPWRDAEHLVALLSGRTVDFGDFQPPADPEETKLSSVRVYPPEILKRLLPKYGFFLKRGISQKTLRLFEAGYAMGNKLNKRICFPIYDEHGRIVGFSGRWFHENVPDGLPKWKHIGKKNSWIFPRKLNDSIVRQRQEMILVESIGDLLALWEAGLYWGICVFGVGLSPKQMSYILGVDPHRIVIALNNDIENKAGQMGAAKMRGQLQKHFAADKIMTVTLPKNDFGAMTTAEIKDWYDKTLHAKP